MRKIETLVEPWVIVRLVELRDIEIFLTLAEELHFGRTGERLRVSPARISQSIKQQERRLGGALFERTSRRVRLTPLGERLRHRLGAGYAEIMAGLDEAAAAARGQVGTLNVGTFDTHHHEIAAALDLFRQRHPRCELRIREILPTDPFGGLRAGRVDVGLLWLPVREPDLVVGPEWFTEKLVLAVASDHPLAGKDRVTMEDLGDHPVIDVDGPIPDYVWEAHTPSVTPAGRPIRRGTAVSTLSEALTAIAAGGVVSPIGSDPAASRLRRDITFVPITDGPILRYAPVWRSAAETSLVRAFVQAAGDTARETDEIAQKTLHTIHAVHRRQTSRTPPGSWPAGQRTRGSGGRAGRSSHAVNSSSKGLAV
jgi:DNA-binding transcriptional LysR family regulator